MPKDPRYEKNMEKFFGVESKNEKKNMTYAERLKKFIAA